MRMLVVTVWILCLLMTSGAGSVIGPAAAGSHEPDTDVAGTTIEIHLETDGDAEVVVAIQFEFDTKEDREAFERFARDFEREDTNEEFEGEPNQLVSLSLYERAAERASEDTDREMEIRDASRESEIAETTGTLELRFRWTNFAATPDDRIEIGDAFVTDGGSWLPSLSDGQYLIVHAPEEYAVDVANPKASVDNGTIVWEGPEQFEANEPNATVVPKEQTNERISPLTIGLGIGLVAAIVALIYLLSRQRGIGLPGRATGERGRSAREDGGERAPVAARDPEPEEPAEPEDDPFGGVDPELLSDEERVVRLLEANGGRMKQASIVVETDWSNAKVSQLLSSMADEGRIEKLRIGRENLITLVEEEEGD